MKIELRRLTLAALVLSTSAAYSANVSAQSFVGDAEADYYGTLGGFEANTGDNEGPVEIAPAVGEEELLANGRPASLAVRQVSASMYIGDDVVPAASQTSSPSDRGDLYWQQPNVARPTSYAQPNHNRATSGGSCDTGCDNRFSGIGKAVCADDPTIWMKAELLLWFPQARTTPPLGATNVAGGALPVFGPAFPFNGTPFADSFGGNLVPGFRGDVGTYLADGTFGIGGRVWVLGDDSETVSFGGIGEGRAFGVPFFNTIADPLQSGENAVLINLNDGAPVAAGDVSIRSSLSIVAAELYTRALVGKSRNHRFELLGGYSHFNIADSLAMRVNSVALPGGAQTVFNDLFETRNEFHGGQIGSEISLTRGRWTASSLTKVHLGNMTQRVNVSGTTAVGNLPADPAIIAQDGLFARGNVVGTRQRDVFSFAPEMNLKIGYQFRDHVNFHAGYSFIYWNNVALAGQQMDRNIFLDANDLTLVGPFRHVEMRSGGLFVQGIDLGATITF